MNRHILKYEMKLLLKNYSCIFFGLFFPLIMGFLIILGISSQIPAEYLNETKKSVLLTINIIAPLSIFLIGHATISAKDMEEGVYDRLELFSLNQYAMARYKFFVYMIFFLICDAVYFGIMIPVLNIDISIIEILRHTLYVLAICVSSFFIAYAICLFSKKYSIAFGISMGLYFIVMILSGMMGVQVDDMPQPVKAIAQTLPTSHFSSVEYLDEVLKGTVNFTFIQGLLTMVLISIMLFALSVRKNKRKVN